MSQPTRWVDDQRTSPEIRELLRSGTRPPHFPQSMLAATVVPLAQKAAMASTWTASTTVVVAIKATSVGLVIGLGSLAAVTSLSGRDGARVRTTESRNAARAARPRAAVVTPLLTSPEAMQDAGSTTVPLAIEPSAPAPLPTALVGIAAEAQLLERARALLDESPSRALLLTDEHRVRFAKAQMSAERELIAVDALLRLGRRGEAERRAEPLMADGSSQVFVQRLRNLLDRHAK